MRCQAKNAFRRRLAQIVSRICAGIFLTVLNACAVAKQHVGLMVFGALRGTWCFKISMRQQQPSPFRSELKGFFMHSNLRVSVSQRVLKQFLVQTLVGRQTQV
jgi:hypothetical protein